MEYNQLKQYGISIHEDTPNTSTPVCRMIPSIIDAKYAKLFLAAPKLYEACKQSLAILNVWLLSPSRDVNSIQTAVMKPLAEALAEAEVK